MRGRFSFNRILIGLIVIAVGVLFLLRQTGYLQFDLGEMYVQSGLGDFDLGYILSTFWPVILIWVGLKGLFNGMASRNGSSFGGIVILLLGVVFLGRNLGWFSWSLGEIIANLWPVAIILVGLKLLWKPKSRHRAERPENDWKSYGKYDDDDYEYDIPPAPPLHPDPLKRLDDEEHAGEPDPKEAGYSAGGKKDYDHEYEKMKEQQKSYKQKQDKHHRHKHWYEEQYWHSDPEVQNRSGFIGDIHIGHDYWELKPLNISHFIGDTTLDLTKAQIMRGETKIVISSFIGDVKVYVPNDPDIGVQVVSSAFAGDVKILGRKEGGLFRSINVHSPSYQETDKKIKLIVSTFLGDVRVTKVG